MNGETHVPADAECTVCVLTPHGRGAVATVALEGAQAVDLVRQLFRPLGRRDPGDLLPGEVLVGHWQTAANAVEEIVVSRRDGFRFELNCHGGPAASDAIVQTLVSRGAVMITAEEWLNRQGLDAIQIAARIALAHAPTARAAGILLDQYRGALRREIEQVIHEMRRHAPSSLAILGRLERLLARSRVGLRLVRPWRVVVAGPPNVGKSSLLNALLGYQRAIVYDEPGTTRDVLVASTAIDGWAIELTDTAGLRHSSDVIEAQGVQLAQSQIDEADLVLAVSDSPRDDWQSLRPRMDEMVDLPPEKILSIGSKCDLWSDDSRRECDVVTSTVTGEGLDRLMNSIVERLVPDAPQSGEPVPFTSSQVQSLQVALTAIAEGRTQEAIAACERIVARLSTFEH